MQHADHINVQAIAKNTIQGNREALTDLGKELVKKYCHQNAKQNHNIKTVN
jgi:hypothetical protein